MSDSSRGVPSGLGWWPTTALVVGHVIGVGIFLTPAQLIGALASPGWTLGLWAACGALVFAGALTFGELASRYPQSGGLYVYLREGWGERVAFLYGWQSLLVMDPGLSAALAVGLSEYAVLLWPGIAGAERWLAVGAVLSMSAVSLTDLVASTRALGALTAVKLVALAVVVGAAFAGGAGDWAHFVPFTSRHVAAVPVGEALALGILGVFFSFGGFWEVSRIAGEVREAPRTLPGALAAAVAAVTLVYMATTAAFIYLVPVDQATSAVAFAERAGLALFGQAGPAILASIVVVSVVPSLLALLIMAPRLYLAMARDGLFSATLATRQPTTRAPARATGLLAILAAVYASIGTLEQIVAFFLCTALGFVALGAAALFRLRRGGAAPFAAPGYPATPLLFVLLLAGVIALVALGQPLQALAGLALACLGVPAHRWLERRPGGRRRRPGL